MQPRTGNHTTDHAHQAPALLSSRALLVRVAAEGAASQFEVSSRDARVLSLAALLVLAVAWLAVYVPARRVRAIAPADALRLTPSP